MKFDDVPKNIVLVQEECAELIHILCKIKRFGYDNHHPNGRKSNEECLIQEMGDVVATIDLLASSLDIPSEAIRAARKAKMGKLEDFYGE